jgi:hypothetical protein
MNAARRWSCASSMSSLTLASAEWQNGASSPATAHAAGTGTVYDATTDVARIRRWWTPIPAPTSAAKDQPAPSSSTSTRDTTGAAPSPNSSAVLRLSGPCALPGVRPAVRSVAVWDLGSARPGGAGTAATAAPSGVIGALRCSAIPELIPVVEGVKSVRAELYDKIRTVLEDGNHLVKSSLEQRRATRAARRQVARVDR